MRGCRRAEQSMGLELVLGGALLTRLPQAYLVTGSWRSKSITPKWGQTYGGNRRHVIIVLIKLVDGQGITQDARRSFTC